MSDSRVCFGNGYSPYKRGITAANIVGDQPVVYGGNAREIGVLIGGTLGTVDIVKTTVLQLNGPIDGNTVAAATVIETIDHGLVTAESVVISKSTSIPSIDGTHAVTVIDANHFSIPVAVTTKGTSGEWRAVAQRTFQTAPIAGVSMNQEVIFPHTGGAYKLEVTAKTNAAPTDLYVKPL